jgi:hypothetical protein
MWSFIFYICCFAPPIFAATPIVDLEYAQYQGVPAVDPINNESITRFLGIRCAAARPVGFYSLLHIGSPSLVTKNRISEFQRTSTSFVYYTTGVQLASKQPPQRFLARVVTAPKTWTPFCNDVPNTSPTTTRRFETRSVSTTELESSEICLFLS